MKSDAKKRRNDPCRINYEEEEFSDESDVRGRGLLFDNDDDKVR